MTEGMGAFYANETRRNDGGSGGYPRYSLIYAERAASPSGAPTDEDPIFGVLSATAYDSTNAKFIAGVLSGSLPSDEWTVDLTNLSAGIVVKADRVTVKPGIVLDPTIEANAPDVKGSLMYDSGSDELKYYDGSWQIVSAGGLSSHALDGAYHTAAGLTVGWVLSADSATTFSWKAPTGGMSAHDLTGAYHTDSGLTTGHFLKATGTTTFAFEAHGLTYSSVGASPAFSKTQWTLPVFDTTTTLGDSMISQDAGGTTATVGGTVVIPNANAYQIKDTGTTARDVLDFTSDIITLGSTLDFSTRIQAGTSQTISFYNPDTAENIFVVGTGSSPSMTAYKNMRFLDGVNVYLGTGNDAGLYFDGTNVHLAGLTNSSDLHIRSRDDIYFQVNDAVSVSTALYLTNTKLAIFYGDVQLDAGNLTVSGGAIMNYRPVDDGHPWFAIGADATDRFYFQTIYNAGTQTVDKIIFNSVSTSGTPEDGKFEFWPDGVKTLTLQTMGGAYAGAAHFEGGLSVGNGVVGLSIVNALGPNPSIWSNHATQLVSITGGLSTTLGITVGGDLTAANIITAGNVDGVDISAHAIDDNAHHEVFESGDFTTAFAAEDLGNLASRAYSSLTDIPSTFDPTSHGQSAHAGDVIPDANQSFAGTLAMTPTETTGDLFAISSTVTLSGALTGIDIDFSGVTDTSQQLRGMEITMPTTYAGSSEVGLWVSGDGRSIYLGGTEFVLGTSDDVLLANVYISGGNFYMGSNAYIAESANAFQFYTGITPSLALTIDASQNLTLASIEAAVADHDKFLVSDSGKIEFRTGAEVAGDIGAATVPLALTDLASYVQGSIIIGGVADWEALGAGIEDYVLKMGAAEPAWGQVDYSELTGTQPAPVAHVLATSGPHTDTLPWSDLNKTSSSLAHLATRAHSNLSDAPTDAHHTEIHVLATTGPHSSALPLTDIASYVQGSIIIGGGVDWEALVAGTNTHVLKMGAAEPAWGTVDWSELTGSQPSPISHDIVDHDTTATGAELTELTDSSETTLHSHAGASVGPGTQWTLPVFDTTITIGDSMLSQDSGGTLLTIDGNAIIGDNDQLQLGDGADVKIYWNGNILFFDNIVGSAPIYFRSNNAEVAKFHRTSNTVSQWVAIHFGLQNSGSGYADYAGISGEIASNGIGTHDGILNFWVAKGGSLGIVAEIDEDGNLRTDGYAQFDTISAATSDLDKFLVSDGGEVKFRTGAEAYSDMDGYVTADFTTDFAAESLANLATRTHASLSDAPATAHQALASVSALPLTISGQAITFNYNTNHFKLTGNNLEVGTDTPGTDEVLTWNGSAVVWAAPGTGADNLGNHIATEDLKMSTWDITFAATGTTTIGNPDDSIKMFVHDFLDIKPDNDRYGIIIRDSGSDSLWVNIKNVDGIVYIGDTTDIDANMLQIDGINVIVPGDLTVGGGDLDFDSESVDITWGKTNVVNAIYFDNPNVTTQATQIRLFRSTTTTHKSGSGLQILDGSGANVTAHNFSLDGNAVHAGNLTADGAFKAGNDGFDIDASGNITDCGSIAMGGALTGVTSIANSTTITSQGAIYNDADNSGVYTGEGNDMRMYFDTASGHLTTAGVLYLEGTTSTVLGSAGQTAATYIRCKTTTGDIYLQVGTSNKITIDNTAIQLYTTLYTNDLSPVNNNSDTVGTSTTDKYLEMFASTFNTGDIVFGNKFKISEVHHPDWDGDKDALYEDMFAHSKEDGATPGLEFWNNKGEMIALLDEDGDFHVRGKIHEFSSILKQS